MKIADFGISKRVEPGLRLSTGLRGTLEFMAPELLFSRRDETPIGHRNYFKGDIWAVGCIAYFVLTNELPFADFTAMFDYKRGQIPCPTSQLEPGRLSEPGRRFLASLLHVNPNERPTARDSVQSDWFEAQQLGALDGDSEHSR